MWVPRQTHPKVPPTIQSRMQLENNGDYPLDNTTDFRWSAPPRRLLQLVLSSAYSPKQLNDGDRFQLALSQIAGKRLTFAEVTGKVGESAA